MPLSDIVVSSPKLAYGEFSTAPGKDISEDCDVILEVLINAGWSPAGDVKAHAGISFPFGFPAQRGAGGAGLDALNRIAVFYTPARQSGTIVFQFYDTSVGETDPSTFNPFIGSVIVGVPIGPTQGDTFARLADKISQGIWAIGAINFPGIGPVGMTLESTLPGTSGNNFRFDGNGAFSTGSGLSEGGGWIVRSSSQQAEDARVGNYPVSANNTHTKLTVANGAPGQRGLQIHVEVDGLPGYDFYAAQSQEYPKRIPWMLWANPFMARFESDTPFHAGDIYVFNSQLWCGSPQIPSTMNLSRVGFIFFNAGIMDTVGRGDAFAQASSVVGGTTHNGGFSANETGYVFYHAQSVAGLRPLETRMGKSILLPAMLSLVVTPPEADLPDESRTVGYMWDAFIETRYHVPGTVVIQEGQPYRAVAAQNDSIVGTLWLRWPVKPPDPGTTQPPPLPQFVGTANVFGYGVTRISGDPFTADIVGRALFINGVPYKVAKFIDSNNINLESVAGIQPGATYHT